MLSINKSVFDEFDLSEEEILELKETIQVLLFIKTFEISSFVEKMEKYLDNKKFKKYLIFVLHLHMVEITKTLAMAKAGLPNNNLGFMKKEMSNILDQEPEMAEMVLKNFPTPILKDFLKTFPDKEILKKILASRGELT